MNNLLQKTIKYIIRFLNFFIKTNIMDKERYEEHVVYSYTRICWYYLNEESGFSMQMLHGNNGPKYFYVIKIKNDGHLDINCEEWHTWVWIVWNYRTYTQSICFLISLIYWKNFSYVWVLGDDWRYNVLDFTQSELYHDFLPWETQSNRIDITEDINLVTLWPLIEWFFKQIQEDEKLVNFLYVVSFYHKGLINAQMDIEISYIDFIRSIEILHNIFYNDDVDGEDIYEWKLLSIWNKIKDQEDLAKYFKKTNWSTRKFLDTILDNLVLEEIYKTESNWESFSLPVLNDLEKIKRSIKNAYRVRSWYIHAWESFWKSVLPDRKWLDEVIHWALVWNDSLKIGVTLSLLWLERIVRNTLLNYFNKNIREI